MSKQRDEEEMDAFIYCPRCREIVNHRLVKIIKRGVNVLYRCEKGHQHIVQGHTDDAELKNLYLSYGRDIGGVNARRRNATRRNREDKGESGQDVGTSES